ncbi:DNA binding [Phytophthora ramorum]
MQGEDIVLWRNSTRKEGCPVSAKMLEIKVLEVAADDGLSPDVFSASYSWRRRSMRRHKLSIRARTRQGQTTPEDAAATPVKFRGDAILEHYISNMFDADHTGKHHAVSAGYV